MAGNLIRLPLQQILLHNELVYEIGLTLEVQTSRGVFLPCSFLFDAGTHFTTIPIADAKRMGIAFSTARPAFPRGATGKSQVPGYLSPIRFSFPALPQWQFPSTCFFTPHSLSRSLLSLTDIVSNFLIRSGRATIAHPHGSLILRLRHDHKGQPRP